MGGDGLQPIPKKVIWGENQACLKLQPSFQNYEISEVSCGTSTFHPYTRYIYIYCLLVGGYMIPTTYSQNRARKLSNIDKII